MAIDLRPTEGTRKGVATERKRKRNDPSLRADRQDKRPEKHKWYCVRCTVCDRVVRCTLVLEGTVRTDTSRTSSIGRRY